MPTVRHAGPVAPLLLALGFSSGFAVDLDAQVGDATELHALERKLANVAGAERLAALRRLVALSDGDDARVVRHGLAAIGMLAKLPSGVAEKELFTVVVDSLVRLGREDDAVSACAQMRETAVCYADDEGLATAWYKTGEMRLRFADRTALEAAHEAERRFRDLGDQAYIAKSLLLVGSIHQRRVEYDQALACFVAALEIEQGRGDRPGVIRCYSRLGVLYWRREDKDLALDYLERAVVGYRGLGESVELAKALNNVGLIYEDLHRATDAIAVYAEGLALMLKAGMRHPAATVYSNLGHTYESLGNITKAEAYFRRSLKLREEFGDKAAAARSLGLIGRVLRRRGEARAGLAEIRRGLEMIRGLDLSRQRAALLAELSENLEAIGEHHEALRAFKDAARIRRDLRALANTKRVDELNARLELERKEREIESLRRDRLERDRDLGRHRERQTALFVGLGFVLCLLALLYRRYRTGLRTRDWMASKNTELEDAVSELRESDQRYRHLFEDPVTPKLLVDAELRLIDANASACQLLGAERGDLIGRNIAEVTSQSLADALVDPDRGTGAAAVMHRWPASTPLGRREFEVWSSALTVDDRPARLLTLLDATEFRQRDEERALADKLESIGVLAGGIAHDFNNSLSGVMGSISLARMSLDDPGEVGELLDIAHAASEQAAQLTSRLVTLAKGGDPVRRLEAIGQLVEDAAKSAVVGSDARLVFDVAEDLWPAEVDSVQIAQMISNLVANAIEAMQPGGTVGVSASNEQSSAAQANGTGCIRITVADSGAGIAAEIQDRIFDPYFTTKDGGSGLGLTTVHAIVRRHGGRLRFTSTAGHGTRFEILLPGQPTATAAPSGAIGDAPSGTGRVLVADDQPVVRAVFGNVLRKLGYDVEVTADGAEAVQRYGAVCGGTDAFDAVFLDLTIPGGMGGEAAIRALRQIDPDVKAVVTSGYSDSPLLANYAQAGFAGMLKKPFTAADLGTVLQQLLGESGTNGSVRRSPRR